MRIGLFTDIYLPTVFGTELATERVRRTLEGMGHRVYVYAPETPGYVDASHRVLRFRSQRLSANPASRLAFSFLPVGRSYRDVLNLRLNSVVVVDDPNPAQQRQVRGHFPLCHSVHWGADDRPPDLQVASNMGFKLGFAGLEIYKSRKYDEVIVCQTSARTEKFVC